jgi:hypothetical protein
VEFIFGKSKGHFFLSDNLMDKYQVPLFLDKIGKEEEWKFFITKSEKDVNHQGPKNPLRKSPV